MGSVSIAPFPEIFLTPVAQPDPQGLGNLLLFDLSQGLIELQRSQPFSPTSAIVMVVPMLASEANAPVHLLDEIVAHQGFVLLFLGRHNSASMARWLIEYSPCTRKSKGSFPALTLFEDHLALFHLSIDNITRSKASLEHL